DLVAADLQHARGVARGRDAALYPVERELRGERQGLRRWRVARVRGDADPQIGIEPAQKAAQPFGKPGSAVLVPARQESVVAIWGARGEDVDDAQRPHHDRAHLVGRGEMTRQIDAHDRERLLEPYRALGFDHERALELLDIDPLRAVDGRRAALKLELCRDV